MRVVRPRSIASLALILVFSAGAMAPAAHAASPVPGRFCKSADVGTKVSTEKYGTVVCKKAGDRARWKQTKTVVR